MPKEQAKWQKLRDEALRWLQEALSEVRKKRPRVSHSSLFNVSVAEYVLLSAQDYAQTAFEAFIAERWHSALSCCRTIFEMSMISLWCCLNEDEKDERLYRWVKTSVGDQYRMYKALALHDTSKSERKGVFEMAENACKTQLAELGHVKELPSYSQMAHDIEEAHLDPTQARWMQAALYKQLCQSVHPQLGLGRFYDIRGTTTVLHKKPKPPPYRFWAAKSAIVWVVVAGYALLGQSDEDITAKCHDMLSEVRTHETP
ncbi:MAG: DUF5677 domain-containing protein [Planctomycetota bacterium]